MPHPLPDFPEALRTRAREAVLRGAAWHANVQIRDRWPDWTADRGRFLSQVGITTPSRHRWPSICWNTARAAQALLSAYRLQPDDAILETVRLAMEYVKSCQLFAPEYAEHAGACLEETPLTDHIASRDTVESIQGFLDVYAVTRDPLMLRRARAGLDWFTGWFLGNGWPNGYIWLRQGGKGTVNNDFSRLMLSAVALAFAQHDALTGEARYGRFIPAVMDWVIDNCLEADGALRMHDGTQVGHHAVASGPLAGCFTNDDGVGIAWIASWRATGAEKYRQAALRNGEWWLRLPGLPETHASVPAGLLYLLDLYRLSSDRRYLDKSLPYIEHVLARQCRRPDRADVDGGFAGHDGTGDKREAGHDSADPLDYISHRTTMYSMLALAKVAARDEAEWNIAYSAFGW